MSLHGSEISMVMEDGESLKGFLNVYHNGLEIRYKNSEVDDESGQFSRLVLQPEMKNIVSIARYPHLMTAPEARKREVRIKKSWHPSAFSRACRKARNILNLMGDAFHQSLSLFLGRLKQVNGTALGAQQDKLQKIGGSIIDLAANAYEPILEPWIGHRILVEGPEGIKLTGILRDYSAHWIELLDVSEIDSFTMETAHSQKIGGIEFSVLLNEAPHGSVPKMGMIQLFNTNPWPIGVLEVELATSQRVIKQEIAPHSPLKIELSQGEAVDTSSMKIAFEARKKADLCLPRLLFVPRYGAEPLV